MFYIFFILYRYKNDKSIHFGLFCKNLYFSNIALKIFATNFTVSRFKITDCIVYRTEIVWKPTRRYRVNRTILIFSAIYLFTLPAKVCQLVFMRIWITTVRYFTFAKIPAVDFQWFVLTIQCLIRNNGFARTKKILIASMLMNGIYTI